MLKLTEDLMTDCILFIALVEQWKIAYLVKELLWRKKKTKTKQKKPWLSNNILHKFGKTWKHKAKNHI